MTATSRRWRAGNEDCRYEEGEEGRLLGARSAGPILSGARRSDQTSHNRGPAGTGAFGLGAGRPNSGAAESNLQSSCLSEVVPIRDWRAEGTLHHVSHI